jgi:excisionase family DNA binding protein
MLSTKEAAQRLGVKTTSAVRQFILAGRLKAEKRGRDWWIDEEEIKRFEKLPRKIGKPKSNIDSQIDSSAHEKPKKKSP